MARDTVAVETLARFAISRMSIALGERSDARILARQTLSQRLEARERREQAENAMH